MKWYSDYLTVYERPFTDDLTPVCDEVRQGIESLQNAAPEVTVSVIAYNEERHLQACLWNLSRLKTKYKIEIIGADNESRDRTVEIFKMCGVPVFTETHHSCGWARLCGLTNARGRYHFNIDANTVLHCGIKPVILELPQWEIQLQHAEYSLWRRLGYRHMWQDYMYWTAEAYQAYAKVVRDRILKKKKH